MNILERANEILYKRSEEKERMYGPIQEGIKKASEIASGAYQSNINPKIIYLSLIALKLSREAYNHKEDNILDAIVYLAALNDYENEKI